MKPAAPLTASPAQPVNPQRLLYSLMIIGIIMPLAGWMLSVALPTIRDSLGLSADVAAWVATAFILPFTIFMPVYGRVSDGLGKRRLLLGGIIFFLIGSLIVIFSPNLPLMLLGRTIQGFGSAGLIPLSLALLTEAFPPHERGRAMGMWSSIGPAMGLIGPLLAGFIVATWGWRSAFIPASIAAIVGLIVIHKALPPTKRPIDPQFLRQFDWLGVLLLCLTLTTLLFYLSSRPITGIPPLQDWRLLAATLLLLTGFVLHERRHHNSFIQLRILGNRQLVVASTAAMLRMMALSGIMAFLIPLYLADVVQLTPQQSGFYLMVNPIAMVLVVRWGGTLSDRWGSRNIVTGSFAVVAGGLLVFSRLPAAAPNWHILLSLVFLGLGMGLMLASLHRAALNNVPEDDLGTSSGIYSMIRFLGSALGGAIAGILLQAYLDQPDTSVLLAYQTVFAWFAGFALLGGFTAVFLTKASPSPAT